MRLRHLLPLLNQRGEASTRILPGVHEHSSIIRYGRDVGNAEQNSHERLRIVKVLK
jgi:hypothetical protein